MSAENDAPALGAKLLAETIAAHGGEAFLNLRTLRIRGTGEFTTPPQTGGLTVPLSSFTLSIATGGRSRLEARLPVGQLLFVVRGQGRGGFLVLAGRTLELPVGHTNGIEPTELLRLTVRQGYPVIAREDAPVETADGKTLLRYDIHRENGRITAVFVEEDTKLVRKTVSETPRGEMTVLLSAYKPESGLPIFGEMQLLENGASVLKLVSSEITLNATMNDALFERP